MAASSASRTVIALARLPPQPPTSSPTQSQTLVSSTLNATTSAASVPVTATPSNVATIPGRGCGRCGNCFDCLSSTLRPANFGAPTQRTWLSWANCKTCLVIIFNFCIAVLGLTAAWVALEISAWTSAKDWREYCASQNETHIIVSKSCQHALEKELPPPPGLSWGWLKDNPVRKSFFARDLSVAGPPDLRMHLVHIIILVLLILCGLLGAMVVHLFRANTAVRQRFTTSQTVQWIDEHRVIQDSTTANMPSWIPSSIARMPSRPMNTAGPGYSLRYRRTWVRETISDSSVSPDSQGPNTPCLTKLETPEGKLYLPDLRKIRVFFGVRNFSLLITTKIPFCDLVAMIDARLSMFSDCSIASKTARLRYRKGDGDFILIDGDDAFHEALIDWQDTNGDQRNPELLLFMNAINNDASGIRLLRNSTHRKSSRRTIAHDVPEKWESCLPPTSRRNVKGD